MTGDFNAIVGKDWKTWDSLGRHGVGSMNGERSTIDATLRGVQPFYIQHSVLLQRGSHNNVDAPQISTVASLDYVIVRQRDMHDVCYYHQCLRRNISDDEEKQRFSVLRDLLQAVPKGDKIVLTGDVNAIVGKD